MARFFVCLYILGDIAYAIIRESSCMGFLPISRYYSSLEEAKLRMVSENESFDVAQRMSPPGIGDVVHGLRSGEKHSSFHLSVLHWR